MMSRLLRLRPAGWALALALGCTSALAAPLPGGSRMVSLDVREEPIERFLQTLLAPLDVPVVVSTQAGGQVNGRFNAPAEKVLRDVARAFNLVTYFDGVALHVVAASELVSRSFALPPAQLDQVRRSVQALRLADAGNTVRASEGALLVTGTRRFVQQVEELVHQGQPPASVSAAWAQPLMDYRVFYLRYAWAQDVTVQFGGRQSVVPGVASLLRALTAPSRTPGASPQGVSSPQAQRLGGQGLARRAARTAPPARGDAAPAGGEVLVAALGDAGAPPPEPAFAADALAPRVEADVRLNAVVVRDLPERLSRYEALVKALDVEPQALEIEATIIDINTDRLRELGVSWRYNRGLSSLMFGNGTDADLRLNGQVDPTPSWRGLAASAVLGDRNPFVARISALQAEGAAKVVSSPQVVTLSNVEAVFDNTTTFYVRVAGRDQVDLFDVTSGTTLRVTPHVFRDGEATRIKLLVQIEDGSLSTRVVDTLPVVERSGVNTQALIEQGESLLIGGMTRDASRTGEDKVPLLGDLPLVGNLFKTRSSSGERVERLFLITPRLASPAAAVAARERASGFAPDAPQEQP